jgi:hypothetical protein
MIDDITTPPLKQQLNIEINYVDNPKLEDSTEDLNNNLDDEDGQQKSRSNSKRQSVQSSNLKVRPSITQR